MEALAAGVPVITTRDAGFHGRCLDHEKNVLFCQRDITDLQDKIMLLKNNQALRETLSVEGRKFCVEHHDIKAVADMYRKIINQCLKKDR